MGQEAKHIKGSLGGQIITDNQHGQILAYPNATGLLLPNVMAGNFIGPGNVVSPTTSGYPGGFRVAKPGYDVRTATDDQVIFDSNRNIFKVVKAANITVTKAPGATTGQNSVSYADLGFIPAMIAFSSSSPLPQVNIETAGAAAGLVSSIIYATINTFVQEVNFTILAPNYAGNGSYTFGMTALIRYYLLQETAS